MLVCAALPSPASGRKDTYSPKPGTRSVAVVYSPEERERAAATEGFAAVKYQFDSVMLVSLAQGADGAFQEAADELLHGMAEVSSLSGFYSASELRSLNSALDSARSALEEIGTLQKRLQRPFDDFMSALSSGASSAAARAVSQSERYFTRLRSLRGQVSDAALSVGGLYGSHGEDGAYLFVVWKMISGLDGTPGSGLCGLIDQMWDAYGGGMERELASRAADCVALVLPSLDGNAALHAPDQASPSADGPLSEAERIAELSLRIDGMWNGSLEKSAFSLRMESLLSLSASVRDVLSSASSFALLKSSADSVMASLPASVPPDVLLSDGRSGSASGAEKAVRASFELSSLGVSAEEALGSRRIPDSSWPELSEACRSLASSLSAECAAASADLWKCAASWFGRTGEAFVASDRELLSAAQSYLPAASDGVSSRQYPREALSALEKMQALVRSDMARLSSYQAVLSESSGSVSASLLGTYAASIDSCREKLSALLSEAEGLSAVAGELSRRAYQAQLDADALYRDAQSAYARGDYTTALEKLEAAAGKYDESLAVQDDEAMRTRRNTTLLELSGRIARAKYENIVREVRTLKDSATTLYYSGEFDAAEAALNRAEQLWSDITVETDDELERLKVLVNTALTMNIGRVLSADDPLYPEMSQILSTANQYYAQGSALSGRGDARGAEAVLNLAKAKLEELQRVYPLNQAANLLTLRINRLLDPVEFERSFESRMRVLSQVDYAARDAVATQSYTELKDLSIINPGYAGMASLVSEAEIALGLRQRPVAVSASQRSSSIAREAQSILSRAGSDAALLESARRRAEEALELDPGNAEAKNVLDEVKLRSDMQDSGVLSSEDEELFQRAKQLFKNNFMEEAYDVIARLSEKNPASKRIKNLKERIELKL